MMINGDPFVNQLLAGCTAHTVPWMHWCFFSTYQTAKICRTAQSFFFFPLLLFSSIYRVTMGQSMNFILKSSLCSLWTQSTP